MLSNTGLYLNDWCQTKMDGLMGDYSISSKDLEGVNIILADYSYEDYSGNSFVLFEKAGKLYEVNGSHCSCYGLEDQWEPEEVVVKELLNRVQHGYFHSSHKEEIVEILTLIVKTGDIDSAVVAVSLLY